MRVLVFTPLHPDYGIRPLSLYSIMNLEYDSVFCRLFAANDNPVESWEKGADNRNIAHNYNKARKTALDGGYDALLTIEADMIVPPDALQLLAEAMRETGAGVLYASYVFRRLHQLNMTHEIGQYGRKQTNAEFLNKNWGKVADCVGLGLGCTLIHRSALECVKFRLYDKAPGMLSCDWLFAEDCQKLGIKQKLHLGVHCGHIEHDNGILWPLENEPFYYNTNSLNSESVTYSGDLMEINYGN